MKNNFVVEVMSKLNRKIVACVLLMPTLVLLLHSIIPHHHHSDDFFGKNAEQKCHINKKHIPKSKACHAFNSSNILIEKTFGKSDILSILFFIDNDLKNERLPENTNSFFKNFNFPIFETLFWWQQILFRGPPAFNN